MRRALGIDGVREHIDRHYAAPLNVGQLARLAGFSTFHFIRLFRATVGATPHQYLRQRRLERAGELLVTTARKVDGRTLDDYKALARDAVREQSG